MANDFSGSRVFEYWLFENNCLAGKAGNDLTAVNTPAYESGSPLEGAYSLDLEYGSSQYAYRNDADLSTGFPLKNGDTVKIISVAVWIKPESTTSGSENVIVCKAGVGTYSFRVDHYSNDIRVLIGYNSGTSFEGILTISDAITAGRKYHLGVAVDGVNKTYLVRIWDDYNSTATTYSGSFTNEMNVENAPFNVGRQTSSTSHWDGLIDELVISAELFTASDFDAIRQGTFGSSITPADAAHAHSLGEPVFVQSQSVQNIEHNQVLEEPSITSYDSAFHQHLLDSPVITQEHEIAPADVLHEHEAENVPIVIVAANAAHSHTLDAPAILQIHCPVIQNATHAHLLESPALTQIQNVIVQNIEHGHQADNTWFFADVAPNNALSLQLLESPPILECFVVLAGVGGVTTHLELTGTCVLDSKPVSAFVADGELTLGGEEAEYDTTYPGVSAFEGGGYLALGGQCVLAIARTDAFAGTGHLALGGILTLDGSLTSSPPHHAFVADGYLALGGESAFTSTVPPTSEFVADGYLKLGDLSAKVGTTSPGASDRAFAGSGFLELGGYGTVNSLVGTVSALVAYTGAGAPVMLLSSNASVGLITPTAHKFEAAGEMVMGEVDLTDSDKFDTWALTGHAFEPAVYSGYDFNSYCIYRGLAYGAKDDGIYLLEGANDAGNKINTGIRIGPHNLGRDVQKRLRSIRLGGNSNGAQVRVTTGQGDEGLFSSDRGKVKVSRDLEDRDFTVDIIGFKELSHLEIVPLYLIKR